MGHFAQKSPIFRGSFAKNDLQRKASYDSTPPCNVYVSVCRVSNIYMCHVSNIYVQCICIIYICVMYTIWYGILQNIHTCIKYIFDAWSMFDTFEWERELWHCSLHHRWWWTVFDPFDDTLLPKATVFEFSPATKSNCYQKQLFLNSCYQKQLFLNPGIKHMCLISSK